MPGKRPSESPTAWRRAWFWRTNRRNGTPRERPCSPRCGPRRGSRPDFGWCVSELAQAGPEHWFSRLLDGGADYIQIHAAAPGDPPFERETWLKANPGLDHLPDLEVAIQREAEAAQRDAMLLPAFEALRLNLGVSDVREAVLDGSGLFSHAGRGIQTGRGCRVGDGPGDERGPIGCGAHIGRALEGLRFSRPSRASPAYRNGASAMESAIFIGNATTGASSSKRAARPLRSVRYSPRP